MACNSKTPFKRDETVMSIEGLSFAYGSQSVLSDVTLDIPAGRLTGMLGPNGAGKTTLFKCCLGFLAPAAGRITLGGKPLADYTHRHLSKHVAYVPQEHRPAFPFLVGEMVAMGRNPHRRSWGGRSAKDMMAVEHAMERVGIAHLAGKSYNQLSGGQRQLVLVARALAQEACLVFLDEPTSSLDFSNQLTVWDSVRHIAEEGVGVVVCSHDPNHVLWYCDNAIALKDGRLAANGPAREVLDEEMLRFLYDRPIRTASSDGQTLVYPGIDGAAQRPA